MRAAALCVLALAACLEPTQYAGPVAVDAAGLERRLRVLCRAGLAPPSVACPSPSRQAPRGAAATR